MNARATLLDRIAFSALLGLAFALAWPGIELRAESDLAPSSRALTSLGASPAVPSPVPAASGDSCAASDPALVAQQYDARRDTMQALAAAMQDQEDGEFIALDGRGYGYFPERNQGLELARLQRDAQLQAGAAAEAAKP